MKDLITYRDFKLCPHCRSNSGKSTKSIEKWDKTRNSIETKRFCNCESCGTTYTAIEESILMHPKEQFDLLKKI